MSYKQIKALRTCIRMIFTAYALNRCAFSSVWVWQAAHGGRKRIVNMWKMESLGRHFECGTQRHTLDHWNLIFILRRLAWTLPGII